MRHCVRSLVRLFSETHRLRGPVVELGSRAAEDRGVDPDVRGFLPELRHLGLDFRPGPGVDVQTDVHRPGLASGCAGTILALDTLEHVEEPRRAVGEVRRLLAPGGTSLLTSTMLFPVHDHPSDYWRFTPAGMESLLRDFPARFVGHAGREDFPHAVFGIAYTTSEGPPPAFREGFERWRRESHRPEWGRSWRDVVRPFVPPALPWLWRTVRRRLRRRV